MPAPMAANCFSCVTKAMAIAVGVAASMSPQVALAEPSAAVLELQESLVEVISQAEQSVVAIARTKRPPQAEIDAMRRRADQQRELQEKQRKARQERGLPVPEFVDPLEALRRMQPARAPHAFGAGVLIDPSGLVLTQFLVVNPDDSHTVTDLHGNRFDAVILASDPKSGLAMLQLDPDQVAQAKHPLKALEMGMAEELRKGQFVVAIGNPFALTSDGQPTASWGTISNIARKASYHENLNDVQDSRGGYQTTLHHFGALIQTDAKLGWNASGGALVSLEGKLVGITTTASTIAGHESPAGYAIPINRAMRRAIDSLKRGKEVEYGLLGVTFGPVASVARPPVESQVPGVRLLEAYPGGPGAKGGLRASDQLLRIDGRPVEDADQLRFVVGSYPPGAEVAIDYLRGSIERTAQVTLGKAYVGGRKVATQKRPSWRGIRVDYPTAIPGAVLADAARQGKIDPEGCVVITEVAPESVSAKNGVVPYLFISHLGGQRVTTPEEFYRIANDATDSVRITFTKSLNNPPAPGGLPNNPDLPWRR